MHVSVSSKDSYLFSLCVLCASVFHFSKYLFQEIAHRLPGTPVGIGIIDGTHIGVICLGIGKRMLGISVNMDLPVSAGLGEFLLQSRYHFDRHHGIIIAMQNQDLGLDLPGLEIDRRVKEAVKTDYTFGFRART